MSNLEAQITNVENLLKNELNTIVNLKNILNDNKTYLMNALEVLSDSFNSDNIIEESNFLPQLFRTLNESLAKTNSNQLILNDLENSVNAIIIYLHSEDNILSEEIENKLNSYNFKKRNRKTTIFNNTAYVQKFINSTKIIIDDLIKSNDNSKEVLIKKFKESKMVNSSDDLKEDLKNEPLYKPYKIEENDTLLISEKQEKIFLPYTLKDISQFSENTEKTIEDIVRENFVVPLNTFNNPTFSRFKETYNLAKNKSNCSILKSLQIAFEVMFNYSLNPAIILACKDVEELKNYLKCLKEQKLDLFKAFKIKYEMNPRKI